ncbi:MAG: DUF4038 domain-containing protein [Fimbriimonas sp.]
MMQTLKVSDNKRFLVHEDGKPFFFLGDTAWELFHRLDDKEAEHYLSTRARQGYNVIQAVGLAEFGGLTAPNANGDLPLHNNDPAKPNDAYFKHVDRLTKMANDKGLYMAMLPTWGDKVNKKWGIGPEIFTPENARAYGLFLGRRYKDAGIIWVLGGDRPAETDAHLAIWRAMAAGITDGDGGRHLKTYHPMGWQSSADKLHDEPWLDFNMLQSGHGSKVAENYKLIGKDYNRTPLKPCMDAEPNYEDHPIDWKPETGWFGEYEVRRAAYWAVFSGAMGHTYGCHDIWQFWQPSRTPVSSARTPWREALEFPGAKQMQHLKKLILSMPFLTRIPAQDLLSGENPDGFSHIVATSDQDRTFTLIYTPLSQQIRVDMSQFKSKNLNSQWFDPMTGARTRATHTQGSFSPPHGGKDWVLMLEM